MLLRSKGMAGNVTGKKLGDNNQKVLADCVDLSLAFSGEIGALHRE
jgi:hypothetical protein